MPKRPTKIKIPKERKVQREKDPKQGELVFRERNRDHSIDFKINWYLKYKLESKITLGKIKKHCTDNLDIISQIARYLAENSSSKLALTTGTVAYQERHEYETEIRDNESRITQLASQLTTTGKRAVSLMFTENGETKPFLRIFKKRLEILKDDYDLEEIFVIALQEYETALKLPTGKNRKLADAKRNLLLEYYSFLESFKELK